MNTVKRSISEKGTVLVERVNIDRVVVENTNNTASDIPIFTVSIMNVAKHKIYSPKLIDKLLLILCRLRKKCDNAHART